MSMQYWDKIGKQISGTEQSPKIDPYVSVIMIFNKGAQAIQ